MGDSYKEWICAKCGQEVTAKDRPEPMKWSDGHVCHFTEKKKEG